MWALIILVRYKSVIEKKVKDKAKMQEVWRVTVLLCCVWAASLLYGEMVAFWVPSLWRCSWPSLAGSSSNKMTHGASYIGDHVKVAVLTDPQLIDKTSHGLAPKSLALEILQFYTDLYIRRSFLMSILPLKPDHILFLGDYFDGGTLLLDEEWQESLSRFRHIFDLNHRGRYSNIPVRYLSGNHDIGYAAMHSRNPEVIDRYENFFGERNYRFTVGKVDFIAVDSQTLDGLKHGNLTSTTWNFVKNISTGVMVNPRVLLTHIPLYRPNWTPCGLHRSSPVINQRVSLGPHGRGIRYQNYLTQETSSVLLDLVRPILVLSGHDHDQCTVTHLTQHGPITEHTLGTVSWQQGNLYPSFMLLSASNLPFANTTRPEDAISIQLCFLPMQTHIYIWYLSLFVFTVAVLLLWPTNGLISWHHYKILVGSFGKALNDVFKGGSKEKDEDETCEYDMIWDAEGSMHLVKKLPKNTVLTTSDSELVGRSAIRINLVLRLQDTSIIHNTISPFSTWGNAVMRPMSKKHISQEIEACEVKVHVPSDGGKVVHKPSRSKTKTIRRLVRTFWFIMTIAAVNIPLYIMLLSKDWI